MAGKKNENDRKEHRRRMLKGLKHEALQEVTSLTIGSLALVVSTVSNQALPRLVGKIVDEKSNGKGVNENNVASSMLISVALFGGIASMVRTTMFNRAEDGIASRLRAQAFRSLMCCHDLEWFQVENVREEDAGAGAGSGAGADAKQEEKQGSEKDINHDSKETTNGRDLDEHIIEDNNNTNIGMSPVVVGEILNQDVAELAHTIPGTVGNLLRSISSCFFGIYRMWTLNPSLLLLSASAVPLIGTGAIFLKKYITKCSEKRREIEIRSSSFIEERITHVSLVKMSNREKYECEKYQQMQDTYVQLGKRVALAKGYFMGFVFSASSLALLTLLNVGGKAVENKKMTSGQLTSFTVYSFTLALGASGISSALSKISQAMLCAARVYKIIDYENTNHAGSILTPTINDKVTKKQDTTSDSIDIDSVDSISLQNVSFQYKSNPTKTILENISMELQRGNVVALVGKNGSGKTTISSILAALYKPTSGSTMISLNNNITVDYNTLPRDIQKQIVQVVPQNSPMFNMSILDNVKYTNPRSSNEEVERVLQRTNCSRLLQSKHHHHHHHHQASNGQKNKKDDNNDKITTSLASLQYQVGLNGCKLSAGEKQRLAVARALLSDPMLLVLDEPTSALDEEGETAISDAILSCRQENGRRGRALLLITHNPKSLQLVDHIVVLKDGQVAETGSYEQLTSDKHSTLCSLMPDLV